MTDPIALGFSLLAAEAPKKEITVQPAEPPDWRMPP